MSLMDILQSLGGSSDMGATTNDIVVPPTAQASGKQTVPPMLLGRPGADMAPPVSYNPVAPDPGASQDSQPVGVNYNNTDSVNAVHQSLQANPPVAGGMTSPGVYGLLPPNLQHGTLRGVLGAISDAMLVQGGLKPEYANSQARQQVGNAMAGVDINDPQSVAAASQRVAATGAPGAADMADKLQQQAESAQLRKATMEQNNWYRQSQIDSRHDSLYNRMSPMAQADLAQSKDAADYAARKAIWDARIHAIDPNEDSSSALGIPAQFGAPGGLTATSGMNNNQITQHQDRLSGQANTYLDAVLAANSRVKAARISAGAHVQGANIEAGAQESDSSTNYLRGLANKLDSGGTLDPGEQAYWNHATQLNGRSRRSVPAAVSGGTTKPASPAAPSKFINGHVYTDAHGKHATYENGEWIPHK